MKSFRQYHSYSIIITYCDLTFMYTIFLCYAYNNCGNLLFPKNTDNPCHSCLKAILFFVFINFYDEKRIKLSE